VIPKNVLFSNTQKIILKALLKAEGYSRWRKGKVLMHSKNGLQVETDMPLQTGQWVTITLDDQMLVKSRSVTVLVVWSKGNRYGFSYTP